jgi:hypothetical protein
MHPGHGDVAALASLQGVGDQIRRLPAADGAEPHTEDAEPFTFCALGHVRVSRRIESPEPSVHVGTQGWRKTGAVRTRSP